VTVPTERTPEDFGSSEPTTTAHSITYYPSVTITKTPATPSNNTNPSFTGEASIENGVISQVEYSLDGGDSWLQTSSVDGSYDSPNESYSLPLTLAEGNYTLLIRSKSLAQVYTQPENYSSFSFVIATTPPRISFPPLIPNPTKDQTPTILAQVTSRLTQVETVQITLDGGNSWKPMKRVGRNYTYTSTKLEDSNYDISIRAFDNAGNTSSSQTQTLIVDTIPPIVGGSQFSLGPQVLKPNNDGITQLVAGAKSKIVLSMKGGPTKVQAISNDDTFDLTRQTGTNLWYGDITFNDPGTKDVTIYAIDGAQNELKRSIGSVKVEDFGKIFNAHDNEPVGNVIVTVYYFQSDYNHWFVWDGLSFGERNPQVTNETGHYSFMLPPGKYYLEAKAPGFVNTQSEIIEQNSIGVINANIPLSPKQAIPINLSQFGINSLSLPSFIPNTFTAISVEKPLDSTPSSSADLSVGTQAPAFTLPNLKNEQIDLAAFLGKKILLSFFSTWSSSSQEQIAVLSSFSGGLNSDSISLAIAVQESVSGIETFMRRGKYIFPVVVDENGKTASNYRVSSLPMHYLINPEGNIQASITGVLDLNELNELLQKLP